MENTVHLIVDFHSLDIESLLISLGNRAACVTICHPLKVCFSQLPVCTPVWAQTHKLCIETFNSVIFCNEFSLKVTKSTYLPCSLDNLATEFQRDLLQPQTP